MQKEIQQAIKDLEAHFAFLANETSKKAEELNTLYKKIESTSSEIEKNNNILLEEKKRISDLEQIIQKQTILISKNNKEILGHQTVIKTHIHEHEKLKSSAMRELQKVNQWIFDAKDDYEKLLKSVKEAGEKVKEHEERVKALLETQGDLKEQQALLSQVKTEISQLRDDANRLMQSQTEQAVQFERRASLAEERAVTAEAKEREFTDSYQKKMQDLAIYENRIREEYSKTFPGRTIKLD
jgi:chromosome segregation ATPase